MRNSVIMAEFILTTVKGRTEEVIFSLAKKQGRMKHRKSGLHYLRSVFSFESSRFDRNGCFGWSIFTSLCAYGFQWLSLSLCLTPLNPTFLSFYPQVINTWIKQAFTFWTDWKTLRTRHIQAKTKTKTKLYEVVEKNTLNEVCFYLSGQL